MEFLKSELDKTEGRKEGEGVKSENNPPNPVPKRLDEEDEDGIGKSVVLTGEG